MKIRFFLLLYLSIHSISLSQVNYYYYPMNTGTTNNLYGLANASYNFGIAVGANGTLLRTTGTQYSTNFGVNWVTIPIGTTNDIKGLLLYNNGLYLNYIWGNNGMVFTSTYSGLNWISHNSGTTVNLNSASFCVIPDSIIIVYTKIFIVGNNGVIITKCDAPDSTLWWQIPSGTTNNLKCIFFGSQLDYPIFDSPVGWICGTNGTLLKTIDRGFHWSHINTGFNNDFNAIRFLDSNIGFIAGNGGIVLRTTNKGSNWYQIQSSTTQTLNCLCTRYNLSNGSTASAVFAAGQNGTVISSSNSGANWNSEPYTPPENINYMKYLFTPKGNYWLTADNGKIYKRNLDTVYHTNENVKLDANNINSYFSYHGLFDNNIDYSNTPGFEWPIGSGKHAIYVSALNIAAFVDGQIRMAAGSYDAEYSKGYCENGNYYTNLYFKIYKVSKNENAQTSWDWANWGQMVPFGAPYIDVNNNNVYEPLIDTPGVRNAKQTIFFCMTDADVSVHYGNSFGGGTQPLGAEVHMTAWAYDTPDLQDVQFISYEIVNKSTKVWNGTHVGIFCDEDLGDGLDDFLGCDTSLKLAYFYNADNDDPEYGINPPAAGFTLLVSPLNRNIVPNKRLGMTSFIHISKAPSGYPYCEMDPEHQPYQAYLMLCGFKRDSTCYLDPTQIPPKKTKFCWTGDPETNTGWTAQKGFIANCNHDSTGNVIIPASTFQQRLLFSSGADNFSILPGESQKFVIAQMIARGSSNLNSVTVLKNLCANVRTFYEQNFPIGVNQISSELPKDFKLFQNYPNPFNPITSIKYQVESIKHIKLVVYNILGKEVATLVNEKQNSGTYEVTFDGNKLASGIYFYKLQAGEFSQTRKMILLK